METENRETLDRTLKPHWVWAIAFGSAIGWGAFVLPTDWMSDAGPLGAVIGLLLGALLMIVIGVSYGFLIKHFPVSGGEFAYAYIGFGRTHAFIAGWFLTLGYMCIVALNATALALLGKFLFPNLVKVGYLYTIAGWDVYFGEILIASLALILFAFFNIRGTSFSGRTQFIFTMILIAGVTLVTIGALMSDTTSTANFTPLFATDKSAIAAILSILAIAPFAYVGFDNIPQAAEEFNFPANKAFKLIVYALLAAGVAYAIMIFITASIQPWQQLVSQDLNWGTGVAIESVLGKVGVFTIATALVMGIFTGLNGFYLSSSRLLFAMSRARILPSMFRKLHPKHKTPYVGILFTAVICLIAPWFGRTALLWIVDMSSTGVAIAYFYCCFTAYKFFSWNEAGRTSTNLNVVAPGKKLLSLLGIISSLVFLALLLIPGSPAALAAQPWTALIIWVVLGIVFYLVQRKDINKISNRELNYLILGKEEI
ncbi:amino acid permease [Pontibacillus halophilus JSM 076056 = DSM 19796]|uniref:Amino acid permease n=1 Tax=Pontibacillus halophilus JSM 076056 = DSM 19796 TaxID=1385510 RepID=A0A0A5GRQ9_9BACI|nr:APC family permease [Pontibacillus halophilus]KGX93928.1 amino acid permease [Pontibacillus halophilus JSM 076056 = DSM 19796]